MLHAIKQCCKKFEIEEHPKNNVQLDTINEKSIDEWIPQTVKEDELFKMKINKLFLDIENNELEDEFIKKEIESLLKEDLKNFERLRNASYDEKRECLLREDLKNFVRLNGLKYKDENYSLLHWSAKYQRPELCAYLMDKLKIDVNIQTTHKTTPLHYLIETFDTNHFVDLNKFIETFEIFLNRNIDINFQDDKKSSMMHTALRKPNYTAVEILLNQPELDLTQEDADMMTPLQLACKIGNEEITNLIIKRLIEHNKHDLLHHEAFDVSPIYLTVSHRHEKYVTFRLLFIKLKDLGLLEMMLNEIDRENKTILEKAIQNSHLQILDLLLNDNEFKNSYNVNGDLVIHIAAKYGTKDLFDTLAKFDCISFQLNKYTKENALHIATQYNGFEFIKCFLDFEKISETTNVSKPMVQIKNKNGLTPLQLAIIKCYDRCVKELIDSDDIELEIVEKENNYSIYHLCILNSDIESLNVMLNRNEKKFFEPLFIKSKLNETPIHLACRIGILEAIRLIMNKVIRVSAQSVQAFLNEKDTNGRTCFHLACMYGHFSVMEYFIKQLKLVNFMEITDNDMNTCLLLASLNGHDSIVELLLQYDANIKARNSDKLTPLEISFRKGYFEMAKFLIDKVDPAQDDINFFDSKCNLLHLAAEAGAHELVKPLLEKGAHIDSVDEHNHNCLDIAIHNEHRDVIKVLLNDANWFKLFQAASQSDNKSHKKLINKESKQLVKLIDKKMWDIVQIILDRCQIKKNKKNENKCFDFTIIDPAEFKDINRHPLMMIANTGQEQLLAHETVRTLLELKWHIIPRLAYVFNIIVHLVFLILFSLYSFDLSDLNRKPENNNQIEQDDKTVSVFDPYLLSLMSIIAFMMLLKLVLTGIFGYFFKIETWIGIITIVLSFLSVTSHDLLLKITLCSISLIFIYLQFAFLIQKVRFFGLYVLAFRGTIKNSAKFFPIFLLIYAGFVLSFRVRTATSDIQYFNDTAPEVFIKGLTLMLGNYNDDQMGLKSSAINYILYALFILILSIIILNLFVGIAVGEITQLLAVATVQQISLRIIFVIQIQYSLKFTHKICLLKRMLNMTYGFYDYKRDESKVAIIIDKLIGKLRGKLSKSNPKINLIDPITRLDEKLNFLMEYFEVEQIKLKRAILNQFGHIQNKMNYSQLHLEESLKDSSRRTLNNMESIRTVSNLEDTSTSNTRVSSPDMFSLNERFDSFNSLLVNMFQSFDYNQFHQNVKLLNHLKVINENTNELRDNKIAMMTNFSMFNERLLVLEANLANLIVKFDKIADSLNNEFSYKLNLLCSHLNDKYY